MKTRTAHVAFGLAIVATSAEVACSDEPPASVAASAAGSGGGGGGGADSVTYHVIVFGKGSIAFGASNVACNGGQCTSDVTVPSADAGHATLAPGGPDWISDALQVNGASVDKESLPFANEASFDPGAKNVTAIFRLLPACPDLAQTAGPPHLDVVWQGDSLVGTSVHADVCSGGHTRLQGSELAAAGDPPHACVVFGDTLAAGYSGGASTTELWVDVPPLAAGAELLVVRTAAGRAMTWVDIVDLPSPSPVAISPTHAPPGGTFDITGTGMQDVLTVIYDSGFEIGPFTTVSTSPAVATFRVGSIAAAGMYSLSTVYNACAGTSVSFSFTVD